jgi:predicted transcriptional regulator
MISLNLLEKIREWNNLEQFLDEKQIDIFVSVFKDYNENNFVYPTIFKRKGIPIENVYKILHYLKAKGILKVYYEAFCHECKNTNKGIYEAMSEIPEVLECNNCGGKLSFPNNIMMIYKIIKEDM